MTYAQWERQRNAAEMAGRQAMRDGLPPFANPYPNNGESHEFWRCWDNGWRDETWLHRPQEMKESEE
mgnify:CR=1 FL=1